MNNNQFPDLFKFKLKISLEENAIHNSIATMLLIIMIYFPHESCS